MSSKIDNIFSITSCPSQDSLLQYVKGELNDKDKRNIEKHLTDCEMCCDEVEGLLRLIEPEKIDIIESELNSKIDIITHKEKKRDFGFFFKIAATVFLILGLSAVIYFELNQKKEKLSTAENSPTSKSVQKDLALIDSSKIGKSAALLIKGDEAAEKKNEVNREEKNENFNFKTLEESQKTAEAKEQAATGGIISTKATTTGYFSNLDGAGAAADELKDNDKADKSNKDERKIVQSVQSDDKTVTQDLESEKDMPKASVNLPERALAQDELVTIASGKKVDKEKSKKERTKNEEKVSEKATPAYQPIGITAGATAGDGEFDQNKLLAVIIEKVNANQFTDALALLETYPQQSTNEETALFYKGLCYYKLNNPKKALAILKELEKNKSLSLYNDIQWYYALSLISLDKKADASKVLNEIIKNKSPYASKAQEELDKIK